MKAYKKYGIALAVVLFLTAAAYFMFLQHQKKTPEYTLTLLQTAFARHDWPTVNKHFAADSFFGAAFDEVVAPTMHQSKDGFVNDFLAEVLQNVRKGFITALTDYTKAATLAQDKATIEAPQQMFARKFIGVMDFTHTSWQKTAHTKILNHTATTEVTLHNTLLAKNFVVQLTMQQLPDGTWQIVKMNNAPEFLNMLKEAQEAKLEELNKPLAAKIAKEITFAKNSFELTTRVKPWLSTVLHYKPTLKFATTLPIKEFVGQVQVLDKDGKVLFTQKYIEKGPFAPGSKQSYTFSWTLNPFVAEEKALIDTAGNKLSLKESIVKISYENGTSLELLEKIPF